MKKFLLVFILSLPMLASAQFRPIVIGDTNKAGAFKLSTIQLNTNTFATTFPGSLIVTNGTVDLQGTAAFKMAVGAGASKVMQSDASGNGTWATAAAGSTVSATNLILGSPVALATTYLPVLTIVNTATTGHVSVNAQLMNSAVTAPAQYGIQLLAVEGSTTNIITEAHRSNDLGNNGSSLTSIMGWDTLTGTARTYILRAKVGSTPVHISSTTNSISDTSYVATNATQMLLLNLP